MVYDSIATTCFDEINTSQLYDLKKRVTRMRQTRGSIATYYNGLQGLWRKIEFCHCNPIEHDVNVQEYNSILQEDRVYISLLMD